MIGPLSNGGLLKVTRPGRERARERERERDRQRERETDRER